MIIIGAGSLGIHMLDVLIENEYQGKILFYDDNVSKVEIYNYPVIRDKGLVVEYFKQDNSFMVAIGNTRLRKKQTDRFESLGGKLTSLISNRTILSNFCSLENAEGFFSQPGSYVSHNATIGKSCILHFGAGIGHDVVVGDYVSISANSIIVGPCVVGDHCFIGPNSVIQKNSNIGKNVIIGSGILINKHIDDYEIIT
jgi:sugar O-acyltransferase (sialic acid O-acetyltransferase NeuD family)